LAVIGSRFRALGGVRPFMVGDFTSPVMVCRFLCVTLFLFMTTLGSGSVSYRPFMVPDRGTLLVDGSGTSM